MSDPEQAYEKKLADLWRAHFGQPMPMTGASEIMSQILEEQGVRTPKPPAPRKDERRDT